MRVSNAKAGKVVVANGVYSTSANNDVKVIPFIDSQSKFERNAIWYSGKPYDQMTTT